MLRRGGRRPGPSSAGRGPTPPTPRRANGGTGGSWRTWRVLLVRADRGRSAMTATIRPPPPRDIRGTTEPQYANEVRRPATRRDTAAMADPVVAGASPFVGRSVELATLRSRIDAARASAGGALLLQGPAGIGKTRTVEEAMRAA